MTQTLPQQTQHTDPLLGVTLADRYTIQSLISRGSSGLVYRAIQIQLGRIVAVKVLDLVEAQIESQDSETRFMREASTLAHLNHPNIVKVIDFGRTGQYAWLVMEYVEGPTLSKWLRTNTVEPLTALELVGQVARAVREAHLAGMVHRDIKPANILVCSDSDGRLSAKLIDFGLVKQLQSESELTRMGYFFGTPSYMAPEIVRAEAYDHRADIYSLGVTAYRLLTGKRPYAGDTTDASWRAAAGQRPRTFQEVKPDLALPPVIEWTVMRCMEARPEQRFADMAEVDRALRLCIQDLRYPQTPPIALDISEDGRLVVPEDLVDPTLHSGSLARRNLPAPSDGVLADGSAAADLDTLQDEPVIRSSPRNFFAVISLLLLGAIGVGWFAGNANVEPQGSPVSAVTVPTPAASASAAPEPAAAAALVPATIASAAPIASVAPAAPAAVARTPEPRSAKPRPAATAAAEPQRAAAPARPAAAAPAPTPAPAPAPIKAAPPPKPRANQDDLVDPWSR